MPPNHQSPLQSIVLFAQAPSGAHPIGTLQVTDQLVRTLRSLTQVCADHDLQDLELAWIQTEAPAPVWHLTDKVPGLKLRLSRQHFELEGHLDGGRRLLTTTPICMSQIGEAHTTPSSEISSTVNESTCHDCPA